MSAVRKNHLDPANPPTRPAGIDLKQLTEERMCRVDDPDSRWQSFWYCGVTSCSADPTYADAILDRLVQTLTASISPARV
jgi:hypothetical protein